MAHPRDIKPDPYRPPTREEIERGRAMYQEGFTVSRILAATDMSLGTLYYWLDGGPVVGAGGEVAGADENAPTPTLPRERGREQAASGGRESPRNRLLVPIPRRKHVVGKRRRPLKTDRVSLTARLWRTTERQVRDIEERLARPLASSPERERDVRMLSSLVRTLRDLAAFDVYGAADEGGAGTPAPKSPTAQELEESLARKLEAIIAERDNETAPMA